MVYGQTVVCIMTRPVTNGKNFILTIVPEFFLPTDLEFLLPFLPEKILLLCSAELKN